MTKKLSVRTEQKVNTCKACEQVKKVNENCLCSKCQNDFNDYDFLKAFS